jgi:hypothetical protein
MKAVFVKELSLELDMRRRAWRQVSGMPDCFVDITQQRRFDDLMQLRDLLDDCPDYVFEKFISHVGDARRARAAKQADMFL